MAKIVLNVVVNDSVAIAEVEKLKQSFAGITVPGDVKKGTDSIRQSADQAGQSVGSLAGKFLQWQIAATLVMKPLQTLREAISSINETLVETENSVISLQRVLPLGSSSDAGISNQLYKMAQQYGQTFENVSEIANNFARTGKTWPETIKATEAALLALNVAELDATQASDGMIAIMSQFSIEADGLTEVIDKLNKVADKFPVTTDKLLSALQRTGSSAVNANMELDETLGIITALSEATGRSGENLGTAVNALIQYSSKSSALSVFEELSDETAKVVDEYRMGAANILDVWMAVSDVIQNMDARQEDILKGLSESEDIQNLNSELHDELGDIFEQVSDVYGTANTFRKNYFIALLGNMKTVENVIAEASDAAGYSAKENEQYMDTYTAKVNTLKAKWQELANDEQGWLAFRKGMVEFGTGSLEVIDALGGIRTVVLAVGTVVAYTFGSKMVTAVKGFVASLGAATKGAMTFNAALGWIGVVAVALSALLPLFDPVFTSLEELQDKLSSLKAEVAENEKELKDLNSELATTKDRIEELQSKEKLTFTEKEEYENLVAQNNELQRRIDLLDTLQREKQSELRDTFVATMKNDLDEDEYVYNVFSFGDLIKKDSFLGNLSSIGGDYAGKYIEERNVIDQWFQQYEDNLEKLNVATQEEREKLSKENEKIKSFFVERQSTFEGYRSDLSYIKNPTTDSEKSFNEQLDYIYDFEDRLSILLDGDKAKTNAFNRLVDNWKFDHLVQDLQKLGEQGKVTAEALDDPKYDEFIEKLVYLGVIDSADNLEDVALAFNSITKNADGAANAMGEMSESAKEAQKALDDMVASMEEGIEKEKQAAELFELQNAILEKQKALVDAIAAARNQAVADAITAGMEQLSFEEELAARKADIMEKQGTASIDFLEERNSLVRQELAVEEAIQELRDAEQDRDLRVYNTKSGQWEWQAAPEQDTGDDTDGFYYEIDSGSTDDVADDIKEFYDWLDDLKVEEVKQAFADGLLDSNGELTDEQKALLQGIIDKWDAEKVFGEDTSNINEWLDEWVRSGMDGFDPSKYSNISAAEKAIVDAQDKLATFIGENTLEDIKTAIENRNAEELEMIKKTISEQGGLYLSQEALDGITAPIVAALGHISVISGDSGNDETEDWSEFRKSRNLAEYDRGGVLRGMGGIKATNEDEVVLGPEVTKRLLEPTSNAQFDRFVKDVGLLFGTAERVAKAGAVSSVVGARQDSHDVHYNVNGVPVSTQMAETHTIAELFRAMPLVKG